MAEEGGFLGNLTPIRIGYDPGERDCSEVGYLVPAHPGCVWGSGNNIVRENQLEAKPGGTAAWVCDGCGGLFRLTQTLNSPADLSR